MLMRILVELAFTAIL